MGKQIYGEKYAGIFKDAQLGNFLHDERNLLKTSVSTKLNTTPAECRMRSKNYATVNNARTLKAI